MNYAKEFDKLCTPAKIYFLISAVSVLGLLFQQRRPYEYHAGRFKIKLAHHFALFFLIKILYLILWTFILKKLCDNGYKQLAWFIVVLPLLMFFIMIGLLLLSGSGKPEYN